MRSPRHYSALQSYVADCHLSTPLFKPPFISSISSSPTLLWSSSFPPECLITGETSRKYMDVMSVVPDDVEELIPEVPIGEERIEKFMQELYKEMTTTTTGTATSAEKPSWTAAGYGATGQCLRWNGWESESCGAAVSDSESTVMAGVEYAGKMVPAPESGGLCGCKCWSNGGWWWLLGTGREERSTAVVGVGPRRIGRWTVRMRRSGLRG
ncbi:hypothetical protein RchiOBHm_Chr6g0310921 [Rosa chinensis]|uniref:Uncharacterized protein n=1 Tax=Rosa chinensis TaxID=74649 RepID=A0A2P6Q1F2_ROSCH|nr:hypothetical protein RchiOBHm_Chr6g0310921 [Rosa chinensis]